jgi:four helix bundle protein
MKAEFKSKPRADAEAETPGAKLAGKPGAGAEAETVEAERKWKPGPFDYQSLDVYRVAREALMLGEEIAEQLPRGFGKLKDQLRRALLSSYLNMAEASSREGKDRASRFRTAGAEASEAAAVEAVALMALTPPEKTDRLTHLLARQCAMFKGLARR